MQCMTSAAVRSCIPPTLRWRLHLMQCIISSRHQVRERGVSSESRTTTVAPHSTTFLATCIGCGGERRAVVNGLSCGWHFPRTGTGTAPHSATFLATCDGERRVGFAVGKREPQYSYSLLYPHSTTFLARCWERRGGHQRPCKRGPVVNGRSRPWRCPTDEVTLPNQEGVQVWVIDGALG